MVTVRITDAERLIATKAIRVVVGLAPTFHLVAGSSVRHGHRAGFAVQRAVARNTGARISTITWNWGDKHSSSGASAAHTWAKAGRYTVTVTVADSSGIAASASHIVTVT